MCEFTESVFSEFIENLKLNENENFKEFESEKVFLIIKTDIKLLEPRDNYNDGKLIFMTPDKIIDSHIDLMLYIQNYVYLNIDSRVIPEYNIYDSVANACFLSFADKDVMVYSPQFNVSKNLVVVCNENLQPLVLCIYVPVYNNFIITTKKEMIKNEKS